MLFSFLSVTVHCVLLSVFLRNPKGSQRILYFQWTGQWVWTSAALTSTSTLPETSTSNQKKASVSVYGNGNYFFRDDIQPVNWLDSDDSLIHWICSGTYCPIRWWTPPTIMTDTRNPCLIDSQSFCTFTVSPVRGSTVIAWSCTRNCRR